MDNRPAVKEASKRDGGVALFIAIWVLALVATIALAVTRDARTSALIAGNERSAVKARAAAEAGIERLALTLLAEAAGRRLAPTAAETAPPWLGDRSSGIAQESATRYAALPLLGNGPAVALDGRRYRLAFGEVLLILSAQAETGKVDLNRGDATVLRTLFQRLDPDEGPAAAEQVLARRARPAGARVSPWRLRAEHFNQVSDLARLGIVSAPLYARLAPYLTVTGRNPLPDPLTAPPPVLASMALGRAAADEVEALRSAAQRPRDWREGLILTLRAEAVLPDGTRAEARALTRISSSAAGSLTYLERDAHAYPTAWSASR